ncbi:MAG: hypothetical protein COA42_21780, partial [Alteromonadaceae bacterium]
MAFLRLVKCTLIVFVLVLAGCGGGGGGSVTSTANTPTPTPLSTSTPEPTLEPTAEPTPEPTLEPTPEPNPLNVSGTAAKGLVLGGVVTIHPVVNGVVDTGLVLGSGTTDANGRYSVTISDYDGGPFFVVISAAADGTTSMRCDLADGCGDGSQFGGSLALSPGNFELQAIVSPTLEDDVLVNISLLTGTVAAVAVNALQNSGGTSTAAVTEAVANANAEVAGRFGVANSGDLTELPIIDLTNPSDFLFVSDNDVAYNLLNAAVVEALMADDDTLTVDIAVQRFYEQYVNNGGLADTEVVDSTAVTLAEILTEASDLIDVIELEAQDVNLNLGALE